MLPFIIKYLKKLRANYILNHAKCANVLIYDEI